MKKASFLRFMVVVWSLLAACTQAQVTPTAPIKATRTPSASSLPTASLPTPSPSTALQPYPPPAILSVTGQTQPSGIGSYCWAEQTGAGTATSLCADMPGIPTAHEPLLARSPLTVAFDLPLAAPQELSLQVIPVTDEERLPDEAGDWSWWSPGPGEPYPLPLEQRPFIELTLDPGLYVLHLFARWQGQGDVSYGFLLQVERAESADGAPAQASPIATAPAIRFAGWSPDSRWAAYWASSQEDVDNYPAYSFPAGTLNFVNVETGETCATPALKSQEGGSVHWAEGGAALVFIAGDGWFTGRPCQDEPFAALADYSPAADVPAPDPALSPDGLYRAATTLQSDANGLLTFETALAASDEVQPLQRVTWQIDQRLGDYGLGGEWVSPSQFLIYETLHQGPLILDVQGGVVPVLAELFELPAVPSIQGEEGYSSRGVASPAAKAGGLHLLLTGVGLESNFPQVLLYHAESGLVETLPYRHAWWAPFSEDGSWLLLDERPDVDGYETSSIWIRRVEDVGGQWLNLAVGVDYVLWADDQAQMAFNDDELVTWQTFPGVGLIGRWETGRFWARPVAWSPDGRYLAAEGNAPGTWEYGLFVLERPTDSTGATPPL